jgi:hypothetical protein
MENQMKEIEIKEMQRAIKILTLLKLSYAIVTPDGEKFGDLNVHEKKRTKRSPYKWGELKDYSLNYIKNMKVGDVVEIPSNGYELNHLMNSASALAGRMWGKGTYTACSVKDGIQMMRTSD